MCTSHDRNYGNSGDLVPNTRVQGCTLILLTPQPRGKGSASALTSCVQQRKSLSSDQVAEDGRHQETASNVPFGKDFLAVPWHHSSDNYKKWH